jgi:catechol 2,3-dioxygenase-like lactoylglutathione lyase family enzyme
MSANEPETPPDQRLVAALKPAPMTHVAVRTTDMEASLDFYRRYAGLEIVHDRNDEGVRVVWLGTRKHDPDFVIVLLTMPYEELVEPCPTDHFGFAVESREAVDRVAELARSEANLKYGPVHAGPIVGYFCLVRDPSGNTCEFSHGQPIHPRDLPDA